MGFDPSTKRSVASWGSLLTALNMETHFLYNLQKWLTKYLKYSKSVTFSSRQRLRHGDLCLCGLKARLIQGVPQSTCRLELPGRSLTAQGPSPGESWPTLCSATAFAITIQSLLKYWCLKPKRGDSQTLWQVWGSKGKCAVCFLCRFKKKERSRNCQRQKWKGWNNFPRLFPWQNIITCPIAWIPGFCQMAQILPFFRVVNFLLCMEELNIISRSFLYF